MAVDVPSIVAALSERGVRLSLIDGRLDVAGPIDSGACQLIEQHGRALYDYLARRRREAFVVIGFQSQDRPLDQAHLDYAAFLLNSGRLSDG